MRADRLLSILLLLQTYPGMTAAALAERLEVSRRTIFRDMEALSASGVPVVAERGAAGGWRLLESYRTNLTGLNDDEIQALFLAGSRRVLADLGLDKASEAAFIKLLATLPTLQRRDAEFIRQRIHIDAGGWQHYEESKRLLPVIQEALWQEHKLIMSYQRGTETVKRLIDPLGLVVKGSIWYLVAAISDPDGEIRTYRVSRILEAEISELPFARPKHFDLAAHWEQSTADFVANLPRYPVLLRAHPDAVHRLRSWRYARIESQSEVEPDGWVTLHVMFDVFDEAAEHVLGCGAQVEVLEPAELRERVLVMAETLIKFYRQKQVIEKVL